MDFFHLSKLFWFIVEPGDLIVVLLVGALILERIHRRRAAQFIVASVTVLLVAILLLPIDQWLARPLENRFPRPPLPPCADGILVLGGGEMPRVAASRKAAAAQDAERYAATVALMQRFPNARVVFSGGSASPTGSDPPESAAATAFFDELGIDHRRLSFEEESRNTWENFVFSQRLAQPKKDETWILVTSALHMPRSIGVARQVGWTMVPWATDYQTPASDTAPILHWDLGESLVVLDHAAKEWIGLVVYGMTHRSLGMFPAPETLPSAVCHNN